MYYKIDFNSLIRVRNLGYERLSEKHRHPTRTTEEYVLYVVTAGKLHILSNGEEICLSAGEGMLFSPSEYQAPIGVCHCEYYWCHFEADTVTCLELTDEEYRAALDVRRTKGIARPTDVYSLCYAYVKRRFRIRNTTLFDYIATAWKRAQITPEARHPERRVAISAIVTDILFHLEGCEETDDTHYLLHRLVKYIERNYDRAFSAEELEREFSRTADHLNRILRRAVGKSIVKYRNALRIEEAKLHIANDVDSLQEIASAVGFENYPYFSRLFKKETGLSPEEYRKQSAKQETFI